MHESLRTNLGRPYGLGTRAGHSLSPKPTNPYHAEQPGQVFHADAEEFASGSRRTLRADRGQPCCGRKRVATGGRSATECREDLYPRIAVGRCFHACATDEPLGVHDVEKSWSPPLNVGVFDAQGAPAAEPEAFREPGGRHRLIKATDAPASAGTTAPATTGP